MLYTPIPSPGLAVSSLSEAMGELLREVSHKSVMPRFRRLSNADIEEKSPGDLVTIADREAERLIAEGLTAIEPQARFVGEEACSRDPSLLQELDEGDVWIVDPIDGTGNYAAGRAPFALMAAYMRKGELVASSIFNPVTNSLINAERGAGAWRDGRRLRADQIHKPLADCRGIISGFQRPAAMAARLSALANEAGQTLPTQRCAGAEYPKVAAGEVDFALYWRTLVWDHAPGVLILEEAGGKVARLDAAPYRPAGQSEPILLAYNADIWDQAAAALA